MTLALEITGFKNFYQCLKSQTRPDPMGTLLKNALWEVLQSTLASQTSKYLYIYRIKMLLIRKIVELLLLKELECLSFCQ